MYYLCRNYIAISNVVPQQTHDMSINAAESRFCKGRLSLKNNRGIQDWGTVLFFYMMNSQYLTQDLSTTTERSAKQRESKTEKTRVFMSVWAHCKLLVCCLSPAWLRGCPAFTVPFTAVMKVFLGARVMKENDILKLHPTGEQYSVHSVEVAVSNLIKGTNCMSVLEFARGQRISKLMRYGHFSHIWCP